MDDSVSREDRKGIWHNIKEGYESLVMTVIRPGRSLYSPHDLGPTPCAIGNNIYIREDLHLKNNRDLSIECSWWKPKVDPNVEQKPLPCVVSLHGNSSCRLGSMDLIYYSLEEGFSIFAFDFSGSGLSEGGYVSLGYHESKDIDTVLQYLRSTGEVSSIILWGRSMGAVAALMCAESDASISAMVLDSPFAQLSQLAFELVNEGKLGVPKFAVSLVMRMVRNSIKKRAQFDMFKLKPIARIHYCSIPAFFGVANEDELIRPHHGEALHAKHRGPKQLYRFPGGHNSTRPVDFYSAAFEFIRSMIGLPPSKKKLVSPQSRVRQHAIKATPKMKNPLSEGMTAQDIQKMTVKQLKTAINRAGFSGATCVEKQDLVELLTKLYDVYLASKAVQDKDPLNSINEEEEVYNEDIVIEEKSHEHAQHRRTNTV